MAELDWTKWTRTLSGTAWQRKPDDILLNAWGLQNLTIGDVIFVNYIGTVGPLCYRWDGNVFRRVEVEELTEQQKAELIVAMMGSK